MHHTNAHDLSCAAGQILIGGFEGHQPPQSLLDAVRHGRLGGVILFARNCHSLEQVQRLCHELAQLAPNSHPLWLAIDHEGGPVQRISANLGATKLPSAAQCAAKNNPRLTYDIAAIAATELAALGFNLNFAPVLDVDTNPLNPIIGQRAYGQTPQQVIPHALAVIAAHKDHDIFPCGKHFPGHGDTHLDSHLQLPRIDHDIERLRQVELQPFAAAIAAHCPLIMTAHILFPAIDPVLPATLSPHIIGILRQELAFQGLIVSDDLEMAAIAHHFGTNEAIVLGLRAGIDLFLICRDQNLWHDAYEHVIRAAEADTDLRDRLLCAARRIAHTKTQLNAPSPHPEWRQRLGTPTAHATCQRVTGP